MNITHLRSVDMARRMPMVPVDAVQGDSNTRILKLKLLENGQDWAAAEAVTGAVAFRKSDGTKGLYDTLPDGTKAVRVEGSTVSAVLAPQVLTCAGEVSAAVVFHDENLNQLAAFPIVIRVAANPAAGQAASNDYYRYSTMEAVSESIDAFLSNAEEALQTVHDTATEDAPAIICEAAGEVISVADAAYRPLKGLSIYGKTIQNGTPTPSAPVALESVGESIGVTVAGKNLLPFPYATTPQTMSGVTFTHGTDGTITCNGTASEKLWYQLNKNFVFLPGVTYTLSGGHAGGTGDTYILYCEGTYNGAGFFYADTGNGITFSFENGATGKIYITIAKGITVSNIVFRPQVEIGNTATVYEPYKGQTLTATAEGGLPGIPVTSGGNYTDEAGQQWICDEVDFARGVYIQNVYTFPLPADGAWTTMDTGTAGYLEFGLALPKSSYSDDASAKKEIPKLCNRFRSVSSNDVYNCINGVAIRRANTLYIYYDALAQGTVEDFKQWLAVHSTTVLYPLATPIETPLTAEELAAFAALHSNKPNTTAFNDAGAEMKLSYVADTKAYIDQKIAAISAAMLNN